MNDFEKANQEAIEKAAQRFGEDREKAISSSSLFDSLIVQPEPQTKIWRYIKFWKYEDLVQTCSLFFSRADRFEDKYEGSTFSLFQTASSPLLEAVQEVLKHTLISCWHMNENISADLWKLYIPDNEGIAIQTTVDRLLKSLAREPAYKGKVIYSDGLTWNQSDGYISGKIGQILFIKRSNFSYEQEYRILLDADDLTDEQNGLHIPVTNLNSLIETIHVSSSAPLEFIKHVNEIAPTRLHPIIVSDLQISS